MNIRSRLISLDEPNVPCKDAEGELGSLVTEGEDVEDLRPLPRLRPRFKFMNENKSNSYNC